VKKLMALVTVTFMAFSVCNVYGEGASFLAEIYPVDESIYSDDFSGTIVSDRVSSELVDANYSFSQSDGTLQFTRHGSASASKYSFIDLKNDGQSLANGVYVVSFKIKKTDNKRVFLSFEAANRRKIAYAYWLPGGNMRITENNDNSLRGNFADASWHDFFFVFDNEAGRDSEIKVYVDNNLIYTETLSGSHPLTSMAVIFENSWQTDNATVYFDDFHVYKAGEPNYLALDADLVTLESLLTADVNPLGNNVLTTNLNLPAMGENHSVITWSSSNPALISDGGTINRPMRGYTLSEMVTMTAIFELGGNTFEKEYEFYVQLYGDEPAMHMEGGYLLYDDFSGENIAGEWYDKSTAGTAVVEDGALKLTNTGGDGQYFFYYYLKEDKTNYPYLSGYYVLEYDMKKDNNPATVQSQIYTNRPEYTYCANTFHADGITRSSASTTPAKADVTNRSDTYHVKYHIDLQNWEYSLWVDDAPVVINAYRPGNYGNICTFALAVNSPGSITVDNLKLYKVTADFVPEAEMESFKITCNGAIKDTIDSAGDYRVSASYTTMGDESFDVPTLIYAMYSSDGKRLQSVKVVDGAMLTADAEKETEAVYGYYYTDVLTVPGDFENYMLKVFTWDGMSFAPFKNAVVIES